MLDKLGITDDGEAVDVLALFPVGRQVQPVRFKFRGQVFKISKVLTHLAGEDHRSVNINVKLETDDVVRLEYNMDTLGWKVHSIK